LQKIFNRNEGEDQIRDGSGLVELRGLRDKHDHVLGAALAQRLRLNSYLSCTPCSNKILLYVRSLWLQNYFST
jgi:hypothetical protein